MKKVKKLPSRINKNGNKDSWGEFLCSFCNKIFEREVSQGYKAKSCGCQKDVHKKKHGGATTRLYQTWYNMKYRCSNLNCKSYKDYGGRGIAICPEWTNDYTKFRDWALNNGYQEGLEIDRKDNNGNYEPSNCRFITRKGNARNKRNNKLTLEVANEIRELYKTGKYIQQKLAEKFNVDLGTINQIIHNKLWRNNE